MGSSLSLDDCPNEDAVKKVLRLWIGRQEQKLDHEMGKTASDTSFGLINLEDYATSQAVIAMLLEVMSILSKPSKTRGCVPILFLKEKIANLKESAQAAQALVDSDKPNMIEVRKMIDDQRKVLEKVLGMITS